MLAPGGKPGEDQGEGDTCQRTGLLCKEPTGVAPLPGQRGGWPRDIATAGELKKENLCPDPGAAQFNQNLGAGRAGGLVTAALQVPLVELRPENRAQHGERLPWTRPGWRR